MNLRGKWRCSKSVSILEWAVRNKKINVIVVLSLIRRHHHHRWAAKFDKGSAFKAIERWRFFLAYHTFCGTWHPCCRALAVYYWELSRPVLMYQFRRILGTVNVIVMYDSKVIWDPKVRLSRYSPNTIAQGFVRGLLKSGGQDRIYKSTEPHAMVWIRIYLLDHRAFIRTLHLIVNN